MADKHRRNDKKKKTVYTLRDTKRENSAFKDSLAKSR